MGITSGIGGLVFGIIQHRGKAAEGERANRAERARERMAAELAAAREELAGSRQAHERLADLESIALTQAQEDAWRERTAQRRRDTAQKLADQRKERDRKSHDRKMLAEAKKQTQAKEKTLKELKRQGGKK